MSLPAGTRIAHFEVIAPIGAGGMGEVYRARDLHLGRDVALKVLPDDVADDPARLARFEREARAAAALNHPNILVVFEVGAGDGVPFVAAELLEGHTLAAELHQPLPVRRAVDYAVQVARGLAAAHDKGIVHRDIKPANLFVTRDGVVKILDFGIAKVAEARTVATMTLDGAAIGTGGYMAPEQARGAAVDARADLFALGAVCYEMLTGRRAFPGETAAESLAAVLHVDPPPLATAARDVPAGVARVVHRCLEKAPEARFQSARDLAFALDSAVQLDAPVGGETAAAAAPAWRSWAVLVAATVVAALGGAWFVASNTVTPAAPPARRFAVMLPDTPQVNDDVYVPFALSPDGTTLAYTTLQPERLYLRRLDEFTVHEVPGTDGAYDPFFSPDGRWIGFWSHGEIKKVPLDGGPPVVICKALDMLGASWGDDGTIVFAGGPGQPLSIVSADGGTPRPLTTLDATRGEVQHAFPQVLSGGRGVLFTVQSTSRDAPFSVARFDPRTTSHRAVVSGGRYGRLLSSGHLVYLRERALVAVRASPDTLEPTGTPTPVVDDVQPGSIGAAMVSAAGDGTLAYAPFRPPTTSRLVWVDRAGTVTDTGLPPHPYSVPRLAPDGRSAAVRIGDRSSADIWIARFAGARLERLTFDRRLDYTFSGHSFSPDGARLTYSEDADGGVAVKVQDLDGSPPTTVLSWPRRVSPSRMTSHGVVLVEFGETSGADLLLLPPGARRPVSLVADPGNQWGNAVSPDERLLVYASNETGRYELFARPFPGTGPKRQLTTDGAAEAVWSHDGRELFFRNGGRMMALPMAAGSRPPSGLPRPLFDDHLVPGSAGQPGYDVARDGRFLMLRADAPTPPPELRIVLNWLDEVKRLVP